MPKSKQCRCILDGDRCSTETPNKTQVCTFCPQPGKVGKGSGHSGRRLAPLGK